VSGAHDRSDGLDLPCAQQGRARARHGLHIPQSINNVLLVFFMVGCQASKRVRIAEKNKTKKRGYNMGGYDVPFSFVRFWGRIPSLVASSVALPLCVVSNM
jgi:hypothetical protein